LLLLLLHCSPQHPALHSFPTRRSSDLQLRNGFAQRHPGDSFVQAQSAISQQGFKLAGPRFLNVFDLKREKASLREEYGGEFGQRSEEHTSELQSRGHLVCRLLLEKKKH